MSDELGPKGHPVAVTDDELAELTVGAVRELVERLDKLEHELNVRAPPRAVAELCTDVARIKKTLRTGVTRPVTGKGAIDRMLADDAARRGDTEHIVRLLRANGVTRYRQGDLEIELRPAVEVPAIRLGEDPTPPAMVADDYEPSPDDDAGPLPPFAELQQKSEELRRQHEVDRSGVEVTEVAE